MRFDEIQEKNKNTEKNEQLVKEGDSKLQGIEYGKLKT
jgi:hypothetical protein